VLDEMIYVERNNKDREGIHCGIFLGICQEELNKTMMNLGQVVLELRFKSCAY
jgi:hypothetical protein